MQGSHRWTLALSAVAKESLSKGNLLPWEAVCCCWERAEGARGRIAEGGRKGRRQEGMENRNGESDPISNAVASCAVRRAVTPPLGERSEDLL